MLKPVKININLPSSKSLTQRALLLNYLSGNKGKIINLLYCDDTKYLKAALEKSLKGRIYLGNAGTAVRFLLPFLKVGAIIDGDNNMKKRPHHDLLKALADLGIKTKSNHGKLPVKILSRNIQKKEIIIDASKSSQYLSSLLMLAPTLSHGLIINVKSKIVSKPYIDLTLDIMKKYGVKVENNNYKKFNIKPQKYKKIDYIVEADASSASYWLAYNHITGSKIKLNNLNLKSKQGDIKFIQALKQLKQGKSVFDFNSMPDCVMSMAIAAIFTNRKITIKNIANLRIKETDRLSALHYNLNKLGIKNIITIDSITIWGAPGFKPVGGARIKTYNDHRIAMAFGILGLKIDKPECVNKSYPNFWKDYQKIKDANIVLTGMRGTGKTTLGQKWAKKWGMKFIDYDQEIEKYANQPIAKIVDKYGWKKFRDLEYKITKKYSHLKNTVIATGGGTLMYPRNYNLLKNNYIILLTADIKTIINRIKNNKNRPALIGKDFISELSQVWQKRKKKYYLIADKIIKT